MWNGLYSGDTVRVSLTEDPEFELVPCSTLIRFIKILKILYFFYDYFSYVLTLNEWSLNKILLFATNIVSYEHYSQSTLIFPSTPTVLALKCFLMTQNTRLSLPGLRVLEISWSSTRERVTCQCSKREMPWISEVGMIALLLFSTLVKTCTGVLLLSLALSAACSQQSNLVFP